MKNLFILILLSVIFAGAMAQETDRTQLPKDKVTPIAPPHLLNKADSLRYLMVKVNNMNYELDYVRHCLNRSHNEKMKGYVLTFIGGVMMGLSAGLTNTDITYNGQRSNDFSTQGKIALIGGSGLSLLGTFMIIDSEKWLRRAYVGPDGLGIKFKF